MSEWVGRVVNNERVTFTNRSKPKPPIRGRLKLPKGLKIDSSHFESPNWLCCYCGFVHSGQLVVWPINKIAGEAG